MRNRGYIIVYSTLAFLFSVILFACYELGKGIEELDSQIEELKSSIEIYKSNNRDTETLLMSYELENANFQTLLHERSEEIKELTKELEDYNKIEKSSVNESDLRLMAQLIEAESGNQPFEGKLAVGTVVMNRTQSDEFPDTIRDVIFQKGQFSVVPNGRIHNEPSDESMKAAKEIMNGTRVLNANVLYFYNPKLTSKTNWIRKLNVNKVIKDHAFVL